MKVKFLGTGTSTGVPEIGCKCEVCTSKDNKNRRLRASVLIHIDGKQILIDCGPDFRQQILDEEFSQMHAVLLTHEHYDHVGGLDDLRPYCRFDDVDIYANTKTISAIKKRMDYSFAEHKYPGVPMFHTHSLEELTSFAVQNIDIQPIQVIHHKLPILGYRIDDFAYLTDVKSIPESEYSKLEGLDTLVINALRIKEHLAHLNLEEALAEIEKIKPKRAYLTHISHQLGLHEDVMKSLPENVLLAYDGLEIEI